MAVEQRDPEAAAGHAVNLANLEPTSIMLHEVLPHIPETNLAGAIAARAGAAPLPESFVQLDEPIDNYEDFVLDELHRGYWKTAFGHFTEIGGNPDRQMLQHLPQEVFDQLPPDIKASLLAQGVGPGSPLEVLSPTASRDHYRNLNMYLIRFQRRYLASLPPAYQEEGPEPILKEMQQRALEYMRDCNEAIKAGDDPIAAMNEYCRNVIGAMNAAHPDFLETMAAARVKGNRLLRGRHQRPRHPGPRGLPG